MIRVLFTSPAIGQDNTGLSSPRASTISPLLYNQVKGQKENEALDRIKMKWSQKAGSWSSITIQSSQDQNMHPHTPLVLLPDGPTTNNTWHHSHHSTSNFKIRLPSPFMSRAVEKSTALIFEGHFSSAPNYAIYKIHKIVSVTDHINSGLFVIYLYQQIRICSPDAHENHIWWLSCLQSSCSI